MTAPANLHPAGPHAADHDFWRDHGTITLSPVAARSVLGLFGIAAATFVVAVNLAGWQGSTHLPLALFPFALTAGGTAQFLAGMWAYCALTAGGIAQFLAGMWAYHAGDALATAMHGIWGSFWIAYGLHTLFIALGVLPPIIAGGSALSAYGFWFVALGAITWIGAAAATTENVALAGVLTMLAAGCTLLAVGLPGTHTTVLVIGAYLLIIGALPACYVAGATVLHAAFGRTILPIRTVGRRHHHRCDFPRVRAVASQLVQAAGGCSGAGSVQVEKVSSDWRVT